MERRRVQIVVAIFVDNDQDKDWDNDGISAKDGASFFSFS
jgi:hypothetical protein